MRWSESIQQWESGLLPKGVITNGVKQIRLHAAMNKEEIVKLVTHLDSLENYSQEPIKLIVNYPDVKSGPAVSKWHKDRAAFLAKINGLDPAEYGLSDEPQEVLELSS